MASVNVDMAWKKPLFTYILLLWISYHASEVHCIVVGEWRQASVQLAKPDCCVVSVNGLEACLSTLQENFADHARRDVDLRARIRMSYGSSRDDTLADCQKVYDRVMMDTSNNHQLENTEKCIQALAELAEGISTALDIDWHTHKQDVFMRVVCASDYRARDPMYHTDKAPLRGYVTICGVGTELLTRPATPWEYLSLRTLGRLPSLFVSTDSIRQVPMNEFIIMKGDYYYNDLASISNSYTNINQHHTNRFWWSRSFACVHRSPPGIGGRRVILSLDLDDGRDDREWCVQDYQREWRSGMTQRKSRLVA